MRKYADVPWYEKPIETRRSVSGAPMMLVNNGHLGTDVFPSRLRWQNVEEQRADIEGLKDLMAESRAWDLMMSGYAELAKMVTIFPDDELEIPYLVKPKEGDDD